ncbi:hypothetical protein IQ250_04940 [Pseudanabaenaceae cyanobacterium LEGE 13415]|nr:hypothetical protein [Pseudanabaenaceae cyanobacterium LEGE 13415]
MDDKSMANQGAVPNQAALEAQQSIVGNIHAAGGSALLDAQAQIGTEIDPIKDAPAATNFSGEDDTNDPTEAKNFTTTGDYPVDFTQLDDEGNLSMLNDAPGAG